MPMMKSLLDSVIKSSPQVSWFAELCVQTCPPTHVHVHAHMHTLLCPPRPVSRADDMHSICSLENRSTQHSPCARKARAWWFMGKGHSVQGDEQEAKFNKELQSDLGTGGKAQMAPSPFQKTSG